MSIRMLKPLLGLTLPLFLLGTLTFPTLAGQMSGTTMAPKQGQNTRMAGSTLQGRVVSFSKTRLTLKLANGKQQTFHVTPRQMGQLKLHKGQTVSVVAHGNTATQVSSR